MVKDAGRSVDFTHKGEQAGLSIRVYATTRGGMVHIKPAVCLFIAPSFMQLLQTYHQFESVDPQRVTRLTQASWFSWYD